MKLSFGDPSRERDGYIVLPAQVDLGNDRLVVNAWLSPKTIAWSQQQMRKGWGWLQSHVQKMAQSLDKYVELPGTWEEWGPLADMAATVVGRTANHPLLYDFEFVREAMPLYEAFNQGHPQAQKQVASIIAEASNGDETANEAWVLLNALSEAETLLRSPNRTSQLQQLKYDALHNGDPRAYTVLAACKAIGGCCCNGQTMTVGYNAERLITDPGRADSIAGYVSDVQLFKAFPRHQGVAVAQFQRYLDNLVRTLPARPNSVVFVNPDEYDMRNAREWGYSWIPPSIHAEQGPIYPDGADG